MSATRLSGRCYAASTTPIIASTIQVIQGTARLFLDTGYRPYEASQVFHVKQVGTQDPHGLYPAIEVDLAQPQQPPSGVVIGPSGQQIEQMPIPCL